MGLTHVWFFLALIGIRSPDTKKHHQGGQAAAVAGYAGPGFHTWPQATSLKTRIRIRFFASGPLLKKRSAPRPGSATHGYRNPDTKQRTGGKAATVAGDAGPGFHNWPPGHIPQDTDPNPLLRSRAPAQKTFGATTGVSDPRLQKTESKTTTQAAKPPL